jgi:hypothetical protein
MTCDCPKVGHAKVHTRNCPERFRGDPPPGYRWGVDGLPVLERRHTPPKPPKDDGVRWFLLMLVISLSFFVAGFTLGCTLRTAQWVIDHVR